MIYCGECGAQNDEDREHCVNCGALLALPLDIPDPVPTYTVQRTSRRYRLVPMVLGALAVLLVAVWAVATGNGRTGAPVETVPTGEVPPRPSSLTTSTAEPTTGPSAGSPTVDAVEETPALSVTATAGPPGSQTETPVAGAIPSPSPTVRDLVVVPSGRIVFSSNREVEGRENNPDYVNRDIYSVRTNGTWLVRLTGEAGYDGQPIWSPDNERIAFTSDRTGRWQIWTMEADGSNPRQLTHDPAAAQTPDWSPDGQHIAYDGGPNANSDIWVIPATGGEATPITTNEVQETAPAWSPTGERLAFMGKVDEHWQIFIVDADGSDLEQVTGGPTDHRYPRWHPDGQRILFNTLTREPDPQVGQIFIMNADGTNRRQITQEDEGRNGRAFPSPDGRHIAFNSDRGGDNYEIYIMRPDGSEVQRLTNTRGDDFEPAWTR